MGSIGYWGRSIPVALGSTLNGTDTMNYLDFVRGFETVKLVQKLQHGSLYLAVSTSASTVHPC